MHELKHSAQLRSSPSLGLVHLNRLSAGKRATGEKTVPIWWRCRGLAADNDENSLDHCAAPKRDCLLLKCSLALFRPGHRRVTIRISRACQSTVTYLQLRPLLRSHVSTCGELQTHLCAAAAAGRRVRGVFATRKQQPNKEAAVLCVTVTHRVTVTAVTASRLWRVIVYNCLCVRRQATTLL
jgi:hypothetical protein